MKTTNQRERERSAAGKIAHYIVTKRGLPCALVILMKGQRAGVLLPQQCGVQAFQRRARAQAAIRRTLRCVATIHSSLHRDWLVEKKPTFRELLLPGEFEIAPVRSEAAK